MTEQQPGLPSEQRAQISDLSPNADILRDVATQWNKAESAIKKSEQVCHEVVQPAISELRYAGRRLIDALDATHHGGNPDKIKALLEDAQFCCFRAQHDAIDAAMSKIAIDLDNLTSKLGFEAVIEACPNFREFYAEFNIARDKIVASREKRDDRDQLYQSLAVVDLPRLTEQYEITMANRPIAKYNALKIKLNGWLLAIGVAVAIITMIFAGLAVDWNKYLGASQTVQEQISKP